LDLEVDSVRIRDMCTGRGLIIVAALAIAGGGCGDGGGRATAQSSSNPAIHTGGDQGATTHRESKEADRRAPTRPRLIDSFRARLVNYHVVRVWWTLAKPSSLELEITGLRHGHTGGQASGALPIRPSDADTPRAASRSGTDRTDFEFGEYNFHGYGHVQFRLRAHGPHRTVDTSPPVVLSRSAHPPSGGR
jgi:hypothetical protein